MTTPNRKDRITHVLSGVLRQACTDARAVQLEVLGSGADADFLRQVCQTISNQGAMGDGVLRVDPASKTALLLGAGSQAELLPFGDLYYSQVVELTGGASLPPEILKLAKLCGGNAVLDSVLTRLFDERLFWESATDKLPVAARAGLLERLEAARFKRVRLGLVPKLSSRTLGIDLYA